MDGDIQKIKLTTFGISLLSLSFISKIDGTFFSE